MTTRWTRTQQVKHGWKTVYEDDWTLISRSGNQIARVFDTKKPDIFGTWRWAVAPFTVSSNQGCAFSVLDAKRQVEARLKK